MYMSRIIKLFLLFIFSKSALIASFEIKPQFGIHSNSNSENDFILSIPINFNFDINKNFLIKHSNRLYHIKHPTLNYLFNNKSRSDITAITELSYIEYKKENVIIKFGRDYINLNKELLFSKYATSFDHLKINYKNNKLNYNYYIIRLNNRNIKCTPDNTDCTDSWGNNIIHYINRWYYYRDISLKINNKVSIYLSESIISTGENRNLEWYYLTPLGLFFAEQNHNQDRTDGDVTTNNDNTIFGLGINYIINKNITLDASIILDEFQIDKEDRNKYQDVFGTSFGLQYNKKDFNINFNLHYSSPWLYLHSGLFTNYQNNNFPIGLKYPHSYIIEINSSFIINKNNMHLTIRGGERGSQNANTKWLEWNPEKPEENKIDYLDFIETIPIEIYFKYELKNNLPNIIITQNWMEIKGTSLIFEWEFFKN